MFSEKNLSEPTTNTARMAEFESRSQAQWCLLHFVTLVIILRLNRFIHIKRSIIKNQKNNINNLLPSLIDHLSFFRFNDTLKEEWSWQRRFLLVDLELNNGDGSENQIKRIHFF